MLQLLCAPAVVVQ